MRGSITAAAGGSASFPLTQSTSDVIPTSAPVMAPSVAIAWAIRFGRSRERTPPAPVAGDPPGAGSWAGGGVSVGVTGTEAVPSSAPAHGDADGLGLVARVPAVGDRDRPAARPPAGAP